MITAILAWFGKDLFRVGGAALIAAMLALGGYQELRVVARDHSIATLETASAAKDKTIGQLRQSQAADQSALTQLAKLSAEAEAAQSAAVARAAASAKATERALAALRATPAPKTCDGAVQWGAAKASELAKGWGK